MYLTPVLLGGEAILRLNQLPAGSQAAVPASTDPGSRSCKASLSGLWPKNPNSPGPSKPVSKQDKRVICCREINYLKM